MNNRSKSDSSNNDQRRRSRRNIKKLKQTKINITSENELEDNETDSIGGEEEDEDILPLSKGGNKKKRKRPTCTGKEKITGQSRYGPEKNRTCPFCKKVFSIVTGLAYHIAHRVCQTPQNIGKFSGGSTPFPPLIPGDQFITTYGIVQVLSDDRAPPDYESTPLVDNIKELAHEYGQKIKRIANTKKKIMATIALTQIQRRKRLLYLDDQFRNGISDAEVVDEVKRDEKLAADIWAEYCTSTTPKVILKRPKLSPGQQYSAGQGLELENTGPYALHLAGGITSFKGRNLLTSDLDPGQDPMEPKDSYPDRIVECVLIPDTRVRVSTMETRDEGEKRISKVSMAKMIAQTSLKREEMVAKDRENEGKGVKDGDQPSNNVTHNSAVKLYLRRNILTSVYNPLLPIYNCTTCGTAFFTRMGLKHHLDSNSCKTRSDYLLEKRRNRLADLSEAIIKGEIKAETKAEIKAKTKTVAKKVPLPKKGRKKRRKKYPSWMTFNPDSSPIYLEVYNYVGFKQVSIHNNYSIKKKKSKTLRNYKRISRAGKSLGTDGRKDAVYPQIWASLFVGLSADQRRLNLVDSRSSAATHPIKSWCTLEKEKSATKNEPSASMELGDSELVVYSDTPMSPLPPPDSEELMLPPTKPIDATSQPQPPEGEAKQESGSAAVTQLVKRKKKRRKGSPLVDRSAVVDVQSNQPPEEEAKQESGSVAVTLLVRRKKKRRKGSPLVDRSAVVDVQSLVKEIRAGRYPSMNPFNGDHSDTCLSCNGKGKLFICEYCSNSEHLKCLKSRVNILDPELGDEFMCHQCLHGMLIRRARNERRRQWEKQEREEREAEMTDNSAMLGSDNEQAIAFDVSTATKAAIAVKREVVWSKSDFDCQRVSYRKCPIGGPGGLICCRPCSTAYSRFLVSTTKEMEGQSVSTIGNEVSELMELLHAAQASLQQSVDVTNTNEIRRGLLDKDEVENTDSKNLNDASKNDQAFGIMDIFD